MWELIDIIYIYRWMWKIQVNTFNEEDNYIGKVVGVDVIMFLEDKNVEFSTKLLA
jgi:small nuclear ribonucleoprotein (snRNP)-like protein